MANEKWALDAPECLIRACESGDIHLDRKSLLHLLRDPEMASAWTQLAKHVKDDKQWLLVWRSIKMAKHRSKDAKRRATASDERDKYLAVAEKIAKDAREIERRFPLLDVLVCELLPQDVLAALGVADSDGASRLLGAWPSAPEVLRQLERLARKLGHEAMTIPRVDMRDRGNLEARLFVWYLGRDFHDMFGRYLYDTLSRITNGVFYRKPLGIDKTYVQGVIRGRRKPG